jgi:hypothetical protein
MTPDPAVGTGPDVFEAWARLRTALGCSQIIRESMVTVSVADLTAVLDTPGRHALTDDAVRRAVDAWNTNPPRLSAALLPRTHPDVVKAMRAAISAALHQTTDTPETPG